MSDPTARTADRMPKVSAWAKEGSLEAELGETGVVSGLTGASVGRSNKVEEVEDMADDASMVKDGSARMSHMVSS